MPLRARSVLWSPSGRWAQLGAGAQRGLGEVPGPQPFPPRELLFPQGCCVVFNSPLTKQHSTASLYWPLGAHLLWVSQRDTERDVWGGQVVRFILNMALLFSNGEGNGKPLQYSCLENPMDGGAWWAAAYGVAQSQTRLK